MEQFCKNCLTCTQFVPITKKPRLQPILSNGVMERVQIDLKEYTLLEDENDGYRYCLSVVDHFSNFTWAKPLKTKEAHETAAHLYDIFLEFGAPKYLQSDNGGEFVNHVVEQLAANFGIELRTGKAYNPREQRKVEHWNGTLATILAKKMEENNTRYVWFGAFFLTSFSRWVDFVREAVYAYRITTHESTHTSPFSVMFGRAPSELQPEQLVDRDLDPIPESHREEINQRVRFYQDKVMEKMKRRWDTTRTIVCLFIILQLTSKGICRG